MAFVLHRGAGLTAVELSAEDLPDLGGWLLGARKSSLQGFYLKLF